MSGLAVTDIAAELVVKLAAVPVFRLAVGRLGSWPLGLADASVHRESWRAEAHQ